MKKSIFIIFNILVIVFTLTNLSFAKEYLRDDYQFVEGEIGYGGGGIVNNDTGIEKHAFEYTIKEAIEITKSNNPLDLVVSYKENEVRTGKIDGSYQNVGDYDDTVDEEEIDFNSILYKLSDASLEVKHNVEDNTIPQSYIQNIKEINDNKNIKLIVVLSFLLIVSIVILILTKKKIVIVASVVILLIGIYHLIPTKQLIDKHNHIEEYILGISNNNISEDVDINKSIAEMKKTLNLKWNISKLINDYIVKVNSCYKLINNNATLPNTDEETWDENEYGAFGYIDDFGDSTNYKLKDIPLLKYKTNEGFIELSNETLQKGIEYDEIKSIYYDVSNNGSSFTDYLNDLSSNIDYNSIDDSELLFHYLARIIDPMYVGHSSEYYNNEVISYFKDWYIDGESRDIELPYGVTLEYKEPEFVKKDIKEIVYTNEPELNIDDSEKQVYVMYYKDSNGNLGASYTDIQFVKSGSNYKILFNPVDLMYEVNKPTIKLIVD